MKDLLILLGISLILAYCSERRILTFRITNRISLDIALVAMIAMLSLFCGLRIAFNDTETYISAFKQASTVESFLAKTPNLLGNPLYYLFQNYFFHHISNNHHLYLVVIAFFTITSFVRCIRKYSVSFTFSTLLFFALGLYMSNFAAMKQCLAMATLTYAIPKLLNRKYIQFYLIVFIAMLWHSYAIMFVILPVFMNKPWTAVTYTTIAAVVAVLFTFDSTISSFLEYAEDMGKVISESEVFETAGINLFRLAVFGVPPLMSFVFQKRINCRISREESLMINMSILSFLIMCLGLSSAANLFGRSAVYFEIGTIIILPWIIKKLFTKESAQLLFIIATVCYIGFFMYDNRLFSGAYRAITFAEFINSLW